jgi:hypothetical protein
LLLRVGLGAPTIGGSGFGGADCLGQRTGVDDAGHPKRPPEGSAAFRLCEANWVRMQMRSPTRPSACRIGHNAESVSAAFDRDNPQ